MIPNIALMISAYIGFGMIEVFLLAPSRYANHACRVVACILAGIAFLVSGVVTVDILMSGTQIPH
jgi:hypothetical protein